MKAVFAAGYGPPEVLQVQDIETPVPGAGQVLVKVHAASLNAGDYRVRAGKPFLLRLMVGGLRKPRDPRLGMDLAGVVEALGAGVSDLAVGEAVFGCGRGTLAEYALARPANLVRIPAGVAFETAAALPVAGLTALQGLRYAGGLQPGQRVLIHGASGGVGTLALQLAKHYGAQVTAVVSPRNLELARQLGADQVLDYTKQDFSRGAPRYDLVFAVNGARPLSAYRRVLAPQGAYVCAGGSLGQIFQSMLLGPLFSRRGGQRLGNMGIAGVNQADLQELARLLASGVLLPLVDRTYPLEQVVQAFRYLEHTHAQGKVVVTLAS